MFDGLKLLLGLFIEFVLLFANLNIVETVTASLVRFILMKIRLGSIMTLVWICHKCCIHLISHVFHWGR